MREAGVSELAVSVFSRFHEQLRAEATGIIPEATIDPLDDVPHLDDVRPGDAEVSEALGRTVIIKLNGGLGTSMGIAGPKTALAVRDGMSFLDIIARQVLALRERHGVQTPLLLMDSFRTSEQSLEILGGHPGLAVEGLPLDFLQNKEPKLRADDLGPVEWPDDPDLEWCPPGPRRRLRRAADHRPARHPARAGLPLRLPVQRRQPRRHVRGSGAGVDGARGHPVRHRGLPAHPQRPQGRPPRGAQAATDGSCCATAPWSPTARTTTSRTPTGTAGSTPTTSGSTSTPWPPAWPSATASSACRSSSTARPSTRPGRTARPSSRSSRPWARRSRSSTARARSRSTAAGSGR